MLYGTVRMQINNFIIFVRCYEKDRLQAGPAEAGEGLAGLDAADVPEQISDMFRVVLVLIAAEHHVGVLAGL